MVTQVTGSPHANQPKFGRIAALGVTVFHDFAVLVVLKIPPCALR
jgi:hypothetical protein